MRLMIIVLLVSGLLWADHDDDDKHHIPKDLSFLNLNDTQYYKVKEILYGYKHDLKAFRHEKKAHQRAVGKLFMDDNFNAEAFREKRLELERRAVTIQSDFLTKLHAILTPWQRERFLYYFDEWDVD